jgi:hypothetical protein
MLGEVNLLDVDIGGPGPFALVSGPGSINNVGKFGRASYYADIVEGWDPILGAAEFIFAQATISVTPGQAVQFSCGQDGNNNMVLQATPWTGTAYAGQELGIAVASVGTNQWGWFQLSGYSVVNCGATTSGATISSITISGQTATVTTSSAHGLSVGQQVTLSGVTPSQYNGSYVIQTVPSTTTFTLTLPSTNLPTGAATVVGSYVYYSGPVAGQTVSGITVSGTTATVTASAGPGVQVGDTVVVASATGNTSVNGTWTVASVNNTSHTFTFTGASITTGVVTGAPTYTVTSPAVNGQAYYSANGAVSSVLVAGKHALGCQWGTGTSAQLGSVSQGKTLAAWQAVLYIGRPCSQGSIT